MPRALAPNRVKKLYYGQQFTCLNLRVVQFDGFKRKSMMTHGKLNGHSACSSSSRRNKNFDRTKEGPKFHKYITAKRKNKIIYCF